jgi:hypothetical protein
MKNIFLFNKISAQDNLDVNHLTVNQELTLKGATPNELLITNSSSDIVTFNNGPDRYLLEIDSTSHTPKWTNNILVDDITTNTMTINNTFIGDLLTIGDNIGSVDRLPNGLNNQVLCVDTSLAYPLKYKYVNQLLGLSNGVVFADGSQNLFTERATFNTSAIPITFTTSAVLNQITSNVVNGRKYKVSASWNNLINSGGSNIYTLTITGQTNNTYVTTVSSSQENIMTAFTAGFTGTCGIQILGAHVGGSGGANGTASKVFIIIEPLGV